MELQTALDTPRLFMDGDEAKLERGYSDAVRQKLIELGHKVTTPPMPIGGAQAIQIHQNGVLEGASDPRKIAAHRDTDALNWL